MDEVLSDLLILLFTTLFFAIVLFSLLWSKYSKAKKYKEWVSWSVIKSPSSLFSYIQQVQEDLSLPPQYRIHESEDLILTKELLNEFQKVLTRHYFTDKLYIFLRSIYGVTGKDYFIFMLYVFLCDGFQYGYFTFPSTHYEVSHKLKYITYMYCKNSEALKKRIPLWNESVLREQLDEDIKLK